MSGLWDFIGRFARLFQWWVMVAPWEQAIRMRLGRHKRKLGPGIHLRIPVLDRLFLQSIRRRVASLQVQTLTAADGRTLSVCAVFGYEITDIEKLYETLHHAEETIRNTVSGAIAERVQAASGPSCGPVPIREAVLLGLDLGRYGISSLDLQFTDFAFTRVHRLVMDSKWGAFGEALNTSVAHGSNSGAPL